MVQLTDRDDAMIAWLDLVRLADMEAVRWALAGLAGDSKPVTLRRAQQWVARVAGVGLVDRARPAFRDTSVVWPTHQATGRTPPNLFRQTTRHEVSVATISARFLALGYEWDLDRKPDRRGEHRADGVVTRNGTTQLIEVELTPKTEARYGVVFGSHGWRLDREGIDRVLYFSDAESARAVAAARSGDADRKPRPWKAKLVPALQERVQIFEVFDVRGKLTGQWPASLDSTPQAQMSAAPSGQLAGAATWGTSEGMKR